MAITGAGMGFNLFKAYAESVDDFVWVVADDADAACAEAATLRNWPPARVVARYVVTTADPYAYIERWKQQHGGREGAAA